MDLPEAPPATLLTAFLRAHAQRESVAAVLFAQGEDLYRRLSPSPPPIPEWGRFLVALGQLAADADDLQVASGYFMRAVRDAELHGDYEAALTAGYDQGVLFEARERPTHARAAYRAAAQGMITLITYGAGMLVGSFLSGSVVDRFSIVAADGSATHQWRPIWLISGALSAVVLLLFWVAFHEKDEQPADGRTPITVRS